MVIGSMPPLAETSRCSVIPASGSVTLATVISGELMFLEGDGVEAVFIEMEGLERPVPAPPLLEERCCCCDPMGSAYMTLIRWPDWGGNSDALNCSIAAAAASGVE